MLAGGRARRAAPRDVADRPGPRPAVLRRGLSDAAAPGRRRRGRGRANAGPPRSRAGLRDRRHRRTRRVRHRRSASRTSTGWSSAGRTRSRRQIGLGPADAVAVLTHDVKFDEPAIVEALRRGCRYVGAVGSKKTQADRRARLARGRRDRRGAGPAARADRPRPGRPRAGRDRARDPRPRSSPSGTPAAASRCASWRVACGSSRSPHRSRPAEAGRDRPRVVAVVLAAGRATRFGSTKVLAPLDGRPILAHVLERLAAAGIDEIVVVVLGDDAAAVAAVVDWRAGRPAASSTPIPRAASRARWPSALQRRARAAIRMRILVALGDQPRISPDVVGGSLGSLDDPRPFIVPRYADGANPNPVLVGAPRVRPRRGGDRRSRPRPAHRASIPSSSCELAVAGLEPGCRHARRPRAPSSVPGTRRRRARSGILCA